MKAEETGRRSRYKEERAGRRGPRPAAEAYEDHAKNVPPMQDDPTRASEPGNRCAFHPAYVLMLDLVRKYRNNCQDQLGVMFGVDQVAMCRYIQIADRILETMLPTPHRFMDILRSVGSKGEFDALFPPERGGRRRAGRRHPRLVRQGGGQRGARRHVFPKSECDSLLPLYSGGQGGARRHVF